MREILDYFKNKKNLSNLLIMGILILAVPIGVTLIRQQQILKSRATNPPITFVEKPNVTTKNPDGSWKTTSTTVSLLLSAPYPPASTSAQSSSQTVQSKDSQKDIVSNLSNKLIGIVYASHSCPGPENRFCGGDGNVWQDGCDENDVPFHWKVEDCQNGCSNGACSSAPAPVNACDPPGTPDSGCVVTTCTTGPNAGQACATGHKYCVYRASGNYWGNCTKEVDNCATQCSTAPPPGTSCTVSWTVPNNPAAGSSFSVTVTGQQSIPNIGWSWPVWKLDSGAWNNIPASQITSGTNPTFRFTVPYADPNGSPHTLTFGVTNGAGQQVACTPTGSFTVGGSAPPPGNCPADSNLSISPNPANVGDTMTFQYRAGEDTYIGGDTWTGSVNPNPCTLDSNLSNRKYTCTAVSAGSGTWAHYWGNTNPKSCGSATYTINGGSSSPSPSPSTSSSPATTIVSGKVVDSSGRGVSGVNIQTCQGGSADTVITGADGTFRVPGLTAGGEFCLRVLTAQNGTSIQADNSQMKMGSGLGAVTASYECQWAGTDKGWTQCGDPAAAIPRFDLDLADDSRYNFTYIRTPVTTTKFRVAESRANLNTAAWEDYTTDSMTKDYVFVDKTPGTKTIFVEFQYSNGRTSNASDCPNCSAQIKLLGPDPVMTSCSLSFEGNDAVLNMTGANFGSTKGTVTSGTTPLTTVRQWTNTSIQAVLPDAPTGQTFPVTITNTDGQKSEEGTCSSISQLALGAKVFCRAPASFDTDDVDLQLVNEKGAKVKQVVKIDKKGVVAGLTQRMENGKKYTLSIKAPKSLRRNVTFTAGGGTVSIPNFVLPVGDIYPLDGGDGKINAPDKAELNREWNISGDATGRAGDFNQDGKINSIDWACMRYDFDQSDDPEPTAPAPATGVGSTAPNANINVGSSARQ